MFNKSKDNILNQIYDISLLDEPVNLEPIDDIPQNRKLQTIYYNLLWGVELKLPKFDGIKSLLIFLDTAILCAIDTNFSMKKIFSLHF